MQANDIAVLQDFPKLLHFHTEPIGGRREVILSGLV
jgi:hypothetical protein